MRTKKTILDMPAPKDVCEDKNCPFHGDLKVRGKVFTGTVVSDKMQKSILVQWSGSRYVPKYERYKKISTKISAHNPGCIDAKKGDIVKIGECRALSKTKNFVVLGVVGEETVKKKVKKEGLEQGKQETKKKEVKSEPVEKSEPAPEKTENSE